MKFRKIRPKHSGEDGGTTKFWNTEIQSVLLNYQPTNWCFFPEIRPGDSLTNFARNRMNFAENRSMERKNREKQQHDIY
jgi:hypothetical protein